MCYNSSKLFFKVYKYWLKYLRNTFEKCKFNHSDNLIRIYMLQMINAKMCKCEKINEVCIPAVYKLLRSTSFT